LKVVLDTNIWISGAANPNGASGELLRLWRHERRFTLLTSSGQAEEFRRTSRYQRVRAFLPKARAGALMNLINARAEFVPVQGVPLVSPDPDDDFIIAIAVQGEADALVSRNRVDLLELNRVGRAVILTPEQLLRMLEPYPKST
jgi:uncharacterized protein